MERQRIQRSIETIDLGFEQLQIVTYADQRVRVLYRGAWLGETVEGPTTPASPAE